MSSTQPSQQRQSAQPDEISNAEHRAIEPLPAGTTWSSAQAVGALAIGALALGALAIGRLVVGLLVIGRSRIRRLQIEELDVKRLRVSDLEVVYGPIAQAGGSPPKA